MNERRYLSLTDYERAARKRLAPAIWEYICGGSGDEETLRADRRAYRAVQLRPRVLVDVSQCDLRTTLLGAAVSLPIAVAPMAYHRLADPAGELATVEAAGRMGALTILSTFSSVRLEAVAAAARGPLWMQIYVLREREITVNLVRRAEAAGYRALVVTADAPRMGRRERDLRNGFHLPAGVGPVNLDAGYAEGLEKSEDGASVLVEHAARTHDASFTWDDLAWLRSVTKLPLVLKGILTGEDAERAAEHGVEGLIVSTHGGRQLDGAIAALDALPEVVAAARGRCEVFVDGGIRRGTHVLKALALGARAVLVGRPVLWGLAVAGAEGARGVLSLLHAELEDAMALSGRPHIGAIDASLVRGRPLGPT